MKMCVEYIHKTLQQLRYDGGRRVEELEALLICRDDLTLLLESIHQAPFDNTDFDHSNGEIRILGVKILTSDHIPSGSIFKIFKDDTKPMAYPPKNFGTSGQIRIPQFNPIVHESWPVSHPMRDDKQVDYKTPDKSEPLVKKRHSETRKIELGE